MKMIDDPRIDAAIESYELAPLPKGFTKRTMLRVRESETKQPAFRLDFIDVAIPFFAAAFVGVVVLAGGFVLTSLNPFWLQDLKLASLSLKTYLDTMLPLLLVVGGMAGMSVFLLFIFMIMLVSTRPPVRLNLTSIRQ